MGSPSSIQGSVTSATEGRPRAVAPAGREKDVGAAAVSFIFLLFFVSGFAALLYQVIWQRVLAIFSGADVYSVTLIVAAFMAGLGCGSVAGGWIADRVSAVVRIALFACAELAIALFAFFSVDLYYGFLYGSLGFLARSPVTQAAVLFVGLLWPTFFMGMSLPLLARALTSRIDLAAGRIGALYAVNTVGAAVGAFATAWLLTRSLGFEGTIRLGSALNLFCALGASAIAPLFGGERTREVRTRPTAGEPSAASVVLPGGHHPDVEGPRFQAATAEAGSRPDGAVSSRATVWIAIYGLSGFIALSLELVWFRLLGVMLKSTAFTFGTLLTIYLAGLALGTFWGIRRARRTREPARAFLLLQAAIGIYAAASLVVLLALLPELSWLAPLWSYFQSYDPLTVATPIKALANLLLPPFRISAEGIRSVTQLALLYFALPAVLIGPPTVMMGLSFPLLQKTVQKDLAVLGRRVGWLQAANFVGSMLGAMVTGRVRLRFLGTSWTL
jgi:spermidine synthase